jgi:hypothetical protein
MLDVRIIDFAFAVLSHNMEWADDFETCVGWLRSGETKTISMTLSGDL